MNVIVKAAEQDPGLRQALFNAVSGRSTYREIAWEALTLSSVWKVSQAMGLKITS
jgi:hypothetical protein